jgi:ornithine decarboxylase
LESGTLCVSLYGRVLTFLSFHVGSGCFDAQAFPDAVVLARKAFDEAERLGMKLRLLDIGGGFPGHYIPKAGNGASGNGTKPVVFEEIAALLRPTIANLFPNVRVIAEPGRFFVSAAFTLTCMVTSRRAVCQSVGSQLDRRGDALEEQKPSFMYYMNDGVYGSFNCIIFDHAQPMPEVLTLNGQYVFEDSDSALSQLPQFQYSMWGPTCDSIDCIIKQDALPELQVGDWVMFRNMGAYTCASASEL